MKICKLVLVSGKGIHREDTGLKRVVFDFEDGRRINVWQDEDTGRLILRGTNDQGVGDLCVYGMGGNQLGVDVIA